MNKFLKIFLAVGILAFSASMTAFSCEVKVPPVTNNTNSGSGNNGGSGGDGNGGCTGICPATNLTLRLPIGPSYVKKNGNTIYIDASEISGAGALSVKSGATDADRGFNAANNAWLELFHIDYPGATAALIFVNRTHVTKDTIALRAGDSGRYDCSTGEMPENTMASLQGGGVCRAHIANDTLMYVNSYLGTVFNNTKTTTHARGSMMCEQTLGSFSGGSRQNINDTAALNSGGNARCDMASINNNLGNTVIINDAWVDDTASTTEVELYAIGIDISGKTFPQFSDATGYKRTEYMKAHDNAAVKRLLKTNKWGDLKIKVKIVKKSVFDAL